jgi:hypothetical protein
MRDYIYMKQKKFNSILGFGSLVAISTLALSACGPQAFVPSSQSSQQTAAGAQNIPPKVDILLGVSTNGTMRNIFPNIDTQIPAFVQGLQAAGWDYHFVSIPLSEYTPGTSQTIAGQVSVSNYDTNYVPLGSWLSPYPGASSSDPTLGMIANLFTQSFMIPLGVGGTPNNAHETGMGDELGFLNRADVGTVGPNGETSFLRSDAMLAVITLSNGDDRTLTATINGAADTVGEWTTAWNGNQYTRLDANFASEFANNLIALKSNEAALVKYYSLVAHLNTDCQGYGSWSGLNYESAAAALGGQAIDICTQPLTSALAAVTANLQTQKLSFEKDYLVIGNAPNVATIVVTKISGGVSTTLTQNDPNGWTYAGYLSNVPTIDAPIPMANATGYMIKLNGTGKLHGNDTANVTFTNAGAVTSD